MKNKVLYYAIREYNEQALTAHFSLTKSLIRDIQAAKSNLFMHSNNRFLHTPPGIVIAWTYFYETKKI